VLGLASIIGYLKTLVFWRRMAVEMAHEGIDGEPLTVTLVNPDIG
jgi:hypothetical protein